MVARSATGRGPLLELRRQLLEQLRVGLGVDLAAEHAGGAFEEAAAQQAHADADAEGAEADEDRDSNRGSHGFACRAVDD